MAKMERTTVTFPKGWLKRLSKLAKNRSRVEGRRVSRDELIRIAIGNTYELNDELYVGIR